MEGSYGMNSLAIVILNWNGSEDTIECLKGLQDIKSYDIYLLDNGSHKNQQEKIKNYIKSEQCPVKFKIVNLDDEYNGANAYYIISDSNMGFAGGNNYIVNKIYKLYSYVLLLNNDTEVPQNTILSMLNTIKKKKCVALTCDIRYYYDKNKLWNAGGKFTWYGDRKYFSQKLVDNIEKKQIGYIEADFITGCALMVDTSYIAQYGLFTDRFFHGEEDFNFCINAKKRGKKLGVDLSVRLYHKVGQSIKIDQSDERHFNVITVHYANRVIDYKHLYTYRKWILWRTMYLLLVFLKRVIDGMKIKNAYMLIKRVKKISNLYNGIDKTAFDMIMEGK